MNDMKEKSKDEKSSVESDEFNQTTNLNINNKRIRDLESLIEKKFNSNKQEETMTMSRKKSIDDDDESKNSTDSKISSQTDFKDYDDSDEPKQEDKEFDDYEFEDDELTDKLSINNKQKCDETELKTLNDFIRMNTNFKFEKLEKFNPDLTSNQDTNLEMEYDHDYNQSELENEENIRKIIHLCKQKYPDLKYKITKCVKTVFKEKFRVSYKKTEEKIRLIKENIDQKFTHSNSNHSSSKNISNKTNDTNQTSRVSNHIFKPQELTTKSNKNIDSNQIKLFNSTSSSPSSSFKHSINNHLTSDLKPLKKFKSSTNTSQSGTISASSDAKNDEYNGKLNNKANDNLKLMHSIHSPSSSGPILSNVSSSSSSPFENKFLNSNLFNPSTATSPLLMSSSSSSTNPLTNPSIAPSQLFDPEFMRLAAIAANASSNQLFRFPDFNALSNPYFSSLSNLFRSNLPNQSSSSPLTQFGLSPPSSFATTPTASSSSSSQPLSLPVSSLTSSSGFNNNNSKGLISPTSKNNGHFFSPTHHSNHHSYQNETNNDKSSVKHHSNSHKSSSQTNGESKYTNGNNSNGTNVGSSISSYILSSSRLKLSNKFSKLTPADVQTVKNLINGYRESAAYLTRTVEELEQLLSESSENESK